MPHAAKTYRARPKVENRPSSGRRGYGRRWQDKYRTPYLRQHPWCVRCMEQGKHEFATQVDHIIPTKGMDDPMHWDERNFQGLCDTHHSQKTVQDTRKGLTR